MEGWGKTLSGLLFLSDTHWWRRTIPSAASTAPLQPSPGLLVVLLPSRSRGTAESPGHCIYFVKGDRDVVQGSIRACRRCDGFSAEALAEISVWELEGTGRFCWVLRWVSPSACRWDTGKYYTTELPWIFVWAAAFPLEKQVSEVALN